MYDSYSYAIGWLLSILVLAGGPGRSRSCAFRNRAHGDSAEVTTNSSRVVKKLQRHHGIEQKAIATPSITRQVNGMEQSRFYRYLCFHIC